MEKWKGRVALVSGASSGIGYAVCENLVKNGMKVVGAARRIDRLQTERLKNGVKLLIVLSHQVYPIPQLHFYTGTKFAVRAISEGLRQELQAINSNIKVTTVSPGLVKTEILRNVPKSNPYKKILEINTCLKPEDIAVTVSQILSAPPYMEISNSRF
ncbi:hypothetical protein Anas_11615 [Armadillidium nasatum]|uniref:Dehydrogenase/reductase SDR family member 11 n=1 Tax=Armadillidium nasatum TaxID=96803 RepID=A0A5N5SUR1_9CRUS|nr:hypothetical protein Anas_11615 [Armadillidium nasatum]